MVAVPKPKKTKSRNKSTPITKQDYERMIDEFGDCCTICGKYGVEAHHLVFRSQQGTNNWRNLAPLCNEHHAQAHRERAFADHLRDMRAERFGPHYGKGVYELYLAELVQDTDQGTYEAFMRREERCRIGL